MVYYLTNTLSLYPNLVKRKRKKNGGPHPRHCGWGPPYGKPEAYAAVFSTAAALACFFFAAKRKTAREATATAMPTG